MKTVPRTLAALVLAMFVPASLCCVPASAADAPAARAQTTPAAKKPSSLELMGKRLYRGTANTGLGWLEIPNGIQEIGNKHGVGAAATWGVVHGAGRAVQRTAVGLFEMLTFPFALTQDNKPILEPEFVTIEPAKEPSDAPAPEAAAPAAKPVEPAAS